MSADDRIKIERSDLYAPQVDEALAREKALRRRVGGEPPPISPMRKLLLNSLFYLPLSAFLGVVAAWLLLEPHFNDIALLAGPVEMRNDSPFALPSGASTLTIGDKEVILLDKTKLEHGADGQPPLESIGSIREGDLIEVAGFPIEDDTVAALAVRPVTPERAAATGWKFKKSSPVIMFLFFPLAATFVALALLIAEGVASRNWTRMIERALLGGLLGMVFSAIASVIPGAIIMAGGQLILEADEGGITIEDISSGRLLAYIAFRGAAWACIGAALGVGMNLVRSTKAQLRNSVLGGALGGALGGTLFDPIDRFIRTSLFHDSANSRLVGFIVLGLSIGIFVALVERLAREAWIRVRTGPLAGKSFVLYKTPTTMGSSPQCDVYLFKDAEIDAGHAQIHRVGTAFEVEDMGSRMGTRVGGQLVRRRRLASGDQIVIGATVLEFEERAKRQSVS